MKPGSKGTVVVEKREYFEAVTIQDGKFGSKEDEEPVLKDINLSIATSQLTIVIGQVGYGKTTLLKAILGKTPVGGRLWLSTRERAFCDQTPWLTNQTLQMNITGFLKYDAGWYSSVPRACALEDDLAQFPEGDQCMVDSKRNHVEWGTKAASSVSDKPLHSHRH